MILQIAPDYRLRETLRMTFLTIGLILILLDVLIKEINGLYFFSFILFIVGGCMYLFSSKDKLTINNNSIIYEKKSIIDGIKTIQIDFEKISKVRFYKRQILIFGGRNPMADADAQSLYHANRIVIVTKDYKKEVIQQIGKLEQFKNAYKTIESKIS
jgi:hypothetical protein